MKDIIILRVMAKFFLPLIMLFALYVQFHGDYGPGGGFQAGVIFAASIVLYSLVFGLEAARKAFPSSLLLSIAALGVLLYAGTGVAALLGGGNFLGYGFLDRDPLQGQHIGIVLVELGVGLTVFAAMSTIFIAIAGKGHR